MTIIKRLLSLLDTLMHVLGPPAVRVLVVLKRLTGWRTWVFEELFVALSLVVVLVATGGPWQEWLGTIAVLGTFRHASLANRIAEREAHGERGQGDTRALEMIFILKEAVWLLYFVFIGAWAALVGGVVFLLYHPWRNHWRARKPLCHTPHLRSQQKS